MVPRILIVDDEPVIRQLLHDVLDDGASELYLAGDADEAIAEAKRAGTIDVAVVDKNLPGRSGIKLIAELKRLQPEAEAIVVTAHGSLESAIDAMRLGVYAYVTKPFKDITEVAEKVQEALSKIRIANERKQVVQELAERDDRHRIAFASSPDAIILYDEATRKVLDANEAAERLYGWERQQLLGMSVDDLGVPAEASNPLALRKVRRRDGSERMAEVATAPLMLGERAARVELARDVTTEPIDLHRLLADLLPHLAPAAGATVPPPPVGGGVRARARRVHVETLLKLLAARAQGRLTVGVGRAAGGDRVALTVSGAAADAETLATVRSLAAQAGGELRMSPAASASQLLILLPAA